MQSDPPSKPSTSAASLSRRERNAAHRAEDVAFSFEIGSGLLAEVRRLQSLIAERDKAIQDMKEEKDELEKTVGNLRSSLRQQEQEANTLKEENCNMEIVIQGLRRALAAQQGAQSTLEVEVGKLTLHLTSMQDQFDQFRNGTERLQTHLEEMRSTRETDLAQVRSRPS